MSAYEKVKEWRKSNPEKVKAQAVRYRAKHPDKLAVKSKKWREKNLETNRERERLKARRLRAAKPELQAARMKRYKERQEAKRVAEAGRPRPKLCEICNEFNRQIVFDHCHVTTKFRGWLCDRCNKVLGLLKDDVILIRNLADYLEKFYEQINNKKAQNAS